MFREVTDIKKTDNRKMPPGLLLLAAVAVLLTVISLWGASYEEIKKTVLRIALVALLVWLAGKRKKR